MAKANTVETVQAQEQPAAANPEKRKNIVMIGILVTVMLVEGLAVFVLVKQYTPPATVQAQVEGLNPKEGQKTDQNAEVELVRFRALNNRSQRPVIYDFSVVASVSSRNKDVLKQLVEQRKNTIQDRFTRLVRAADPQYFQEPDLATLRRQFKHELNEVTGDPDMVLEVLFPSIVPYTDY